MYAQNEKPELRDLCTKQHKFKIQVYLQQNKKKGGSRVFKRAPCFFLSFLFFSIFSNWKSS
jgi:hypothetical protein